MGNHILNNRLAIEKQPVSLYGNFVILGSGAVGTVKGLGILSVTKESTAGQYTIVLEEKWNRLLSAKGGFVKDGNGSGIASVEIITAPASLQGQIQAGTGYTIQFYDYTGVAADAASGSVHSFEVCLRRSSVGPV